MTIHRPTGPTDAERMDRAVTALLADDPVAVPSTLAGELATARAIRAGLPVVPPGAAFEADLARQLGTGDLSTDRRLTEFIRHHHRMVLTGAVGSVVVSTASVAVMAWRLGHRQP